MSGRTQPVLCLVWGLVGGAVALYGFGSTNADARLLVVAATLAGVGCAVAAALLLSRGRSRAAGLSLMASAVIPTWGAAALNLIPLVAGLALLLLPRRLAPGHHRRPIAASP